MVKMKKIMEITRVGNLVGMHRQVVRLTVMPDQVLPVKGG